MSALPRFVACRGSAFLPQVQSLPDEDTQRGQAIHGWVLEGREPPEEFRDECRALDVSALPEGESEVAVAYNWREDSARILGKGLNRQYPAEGDELCGSLDRVVLQPESVLVVDVKTGRCSHEQARWQLVAGALAMCRATGRDSAVIAVAHVVDGALVMGRAEMLGPLELAAAAAEIEAAFSAPPTANVVEGDHCRHCPAFAACPAKAALARNLMGRPELRIDDETVPAILQRCDDVEKAVKLARAAVREYVTHNPVHLPDGSVLAMQEVARETIDAVKARAVLPERVWQAAVETKMTKTALDAALKADGAMSKKMAYGQLRAAGAVSTSTHLELRKVKPKHAALPADTEAQ
jgi:hypothetical protein